MAIGDTVNAGLMRTDFSAFQQAGLANAQANAAFGNAVGNFIDDFYEKKKLKEEKQEREKFYRSQGFNPDEAKAASGDKELANFLARKRVEDRNFEIAEKDLLLRGQDAEQKRVASSRAGVLFDEQLREIGNKKLEEEKAREANRFMLRTPPPTPIQDKDFDGFIANLKANKGPLLPPRNAPALAGLTGEFAEVGKRIQEGFESGKINEDEAIERIQGLQARQDALTPAPMTPQQALAAQKMIADMERDESKEERDVMEFDQKQSFLTFTPANNFLAISNGGKVTKLPISGVVGNEKLAGDLKSEISAFNDMDQLFSRLITLSDEEGWFDSEALKTEANGLVRSIQGRIRENVLGPGTVTDSERAILDQIVTNPYSKTVLLTTGQRVNLLQKLRTQLTNNFQNKLTNSGLEIGQSSGGSSPSDSSDALNDGTTYDFNLE